MSPNEADEQSDDDYWIDAARTAQLVAQFNDWCQHELETESRFKGYRRIGGFLAEFVALTCIPLRLVHGEAAKVSWEAKQLSLFLAPSPLACEDKAIEAWIYSGEAAASEPGNTVVPGSTPLRIVTLR